MRLHNAMFSYTVMGLQLWVGVQDKHTMKNNRF